MRIIYITTDPSWGGSSVALYNLIKGLYKNHEIHVVLPTISGRLGEELRKLGVKCHEKKIGGTQVWPRYHSFTEFVVHHWWFIKSIVYRLLAKRFISNLLDMVKPDIVHVNVGPIDISLDACIKRNIHHVWHIRENQEQMGNCFFPSMGYFYKRIHNNHNHCIAVTKGLFDYYSLRPKQDVVIYDGVLSNQSHIIKPITFQRDYFLMVGTIQKIKGIIEGILAFEQFDKTNPGYQLLIAGGWKKDSTYKKECDDYIETHHLNDKIVFLGNRTDVYSLMRQAKALVAPNYFEGFGFTVVEAMANNCLVIGRSVGGIKEQFDNGLEITGQEIAYRFINNDEIPVLMEKALHCDTEEMRKKANQVVTQLYTTSTNVREILSYYQKIINS